MRPASQQTRRPDPSLTRFPVMRALGVSPGAPVAIKVASFADSTPKVPLRVYPNEKTLIPDRPAWKAGAHSPGLLVRRPGSLSRPEGETLQMQLLHASAADETSSSLLADSSRELRRLSPGAGRSADFGDIQARQRSGVLPVLSPGDLPSLSQRRNILKLPGNMASQAGSRHCSADLLPVDQEGPRASNKLKDALKNLRPKDTKQERMDRLSETRRIRARTAPGSSGHHYHIPSDGHRDRVNRDDIAFAEECWHKYFFQKTRNHLEKEDMQRVVEALADFGIKADNRTEKLQLQSALAIFGVETQKEDGSEGGSVGLSKFLDLIAEARHKLRIARSSRVFHAWRLLDKEEQGALPPPKVIKLLEDLGHTPAEGTKERKELEAYVQSVAAARGGLLNFHEVEFIAGETREHDVRERRRREEDIKKMHKLCDENEFFFKEHRSQLLELHSAFQLMLEDDDQGALSLGPSHSHEKKHRDSLDVEEVLGLLEDLGCLTFDTSSDCEAKWERVEGIIEDQCKKEEDLHRPRTAEGPGLSFLGFLKVLNKLRNLEMTEKASDVMVLFELYDLDRSNSLDIKEVCLFLVDLNLQPKTPQEQEVIANLMEEVDKDGSGQLEVDELLHLVQRVSERVCQLKREAENAYAKKLGFPLKKTIYLRRAFEKLDFNKNGFLDAREVGLCIKVLCSSVGGIKLTAKRLKAVFGDHFESFEEEIDFLEFLSLMRNAEEQINDQLSAQAGSLPGQPTAGPGALQSEEVNEEDVNAGMGTLAATVWGLEQDEEKVLAKSLSRRVSGLPMHPLVAALSSSEASR